MRRPARPQRGGQVDDDAPADRAGDPGRGRDRDPRPTGCRSESKVARASCGVVPQLDNLDVTLTVEQNLLVFAHLYRIERAHRQRRRRARADDREPDRPPRHEGRQALRRHAPAPADRPRPGPPAPAGAARRADRRPGPAGPPGAVGADRPAALGGHEHPDVDALHRGGRAPLRQRDDHVPRLGGRHRPAARPGRRARGRGGGRGLRAAGQAGRGRARRAQEDGHKTRRTGTSVSVLGANGNAPEGERRPTNLEDVFVLLTGEEIA